MFHQSSTTNVLPTVNPSAACNLESGYNWKTWVKTGALLATVATVGGAFPFIFSWLNSSPSEADGLTEDRVVEVTDDSVVPDQVGALEAGQHEQTIQHDMGLLSSEQNAYELLSLTDFKELPLTTTTQQRKKRNPISTPEKIGSEFQVNTYTNDSQWQPFPESISNNSFVIIWMSDNQDGDSCGIFGQFFNINGTKVGNEFQVNTYTTGFQGYPIVKRLSSENFVVAWQGSGVQDNYGISAQIFNTNGTKVETEFQVNTYMTNVQEGPSVARLNDERFIITWHSDGQDGDGWGIYGQLYHVNGTKYGIEFPINTNIAGHQAHSAVSGINNDTFVTTWHSPDASSYGIFAQLFTINGTKVGSEFPVNSYVTNYQKGPSVTKLGNNKFVICWTSDIQDGSSWGIFGQIFNINGTKVGNEFQVNTYTANTQVFCTVVELQNGEFMVTWMSTGQDGSGDGVYAQRFSANAAKIGQEIRINSYITDNQNYPRIATLSNDNLVVTWRSENQDGSSYGIYAKIISSNGACTFTSSALTSTPVTSTTNMASSIIPSSVVSSQMVPSSSVSSNDTAISVSSSNFVSQSSLTDEPTSIIKSQELSDIGSEEKNNIEGAVVGGIVGGCLVLCVVGSGVGYLLYRRNRQAELTEIQLESPSPKTDTRAETTSLQIIPKSRIRFGDMLGKGAFGEVYRGRWRGAKVAIKQLPMQIVEFDSQAIDEFEREASLMAKLQHPNIVHFYGVSKSSDHYCIVMEYMSGGSLDKTLYNLGIALPWVPVRWQIMQDITYGLGYLHDRDIFHRDLKSQNILLDENMRAKLTDFGMSKITGDASKTMTKGVGTVCWMAPEIMQSKEGKTHYTIKADVYSYGIILWELATREEPYKDLTQFTIPSAVFRGERPKIPQDCPLTYACLMERCWAQRADDRPTMAEVEGELESVETELMAMNAVEHSASVTQTV